MLDGVTQQMGPIRAKSGNATAVCTLANADRLAKIAKLKLELAALEREVGDAGTTKRDSATGTLICEALNFPGRFHPVELCRNRNRNRNAQKKPKQVNPIELFT